MRKINELVPALQGRSSADTEPEVEPSAEGEDSEAADEESEDLEKKDESKDTDDEPEGEPEGEKSEDGTLAKRMKARAERAEKERDVFKRELDKLTESKGEVSEEALQKLADDHDVSLDFVKGFLSVMQQNILEATDSLVDEKLSKREKESEKERILQAFKTGFDKAVSEWEGKELNEDAVRLHYLTNLRKEPAHSVEDSITAIYGSFKEGRQTVESEPQGTGDEGGERVDFSEAAKDPEKLKQLLSDPKGKKAYYAWRDKQGK
jgi:hypothetical protein